MKKIVLSMLILGMSVSLSAQKIDFENDALGTPVGVTTGSASTLEIINNTNPDGNDSKKVMKVTHRSYNMMFFDNFPITDGDRASYLYSKIRFKICVLGGSDVNFPQFDIFSSADFYNVTQATERLVRLPWTSLWGFPSIGKWKTIEFSFSKSVLDPIPAGKLVLQLVKDNCDFLIDDIEVVPFPEAVNGYLNLQNFETNKIGDVFDMKAFNSTDYTNAVAADLENSANKAMHITTTNYGAFLKFTVDLEAGKTLADYDQISYDVYLMTGFGNNNQNFPVFVNDVNIYTDLEPWPTQAPDQLWTTIKHELKNIDPTVISLNSFSMALGISSNNANYYIDNIKLRQMGYTGIKSTNGNKINITVNRNRIQLNQTVESLELYDINGRKLISAENTSAVNVSSLANGIYIVKSKFEGRTFVSKVSKQ